MSLRLLDLRGATAPFDQVLPRPDDPGSDVHEAVAEVLRQVRQDGDEAIVGFTAQFDRVDVSDGLRVPPADISAALDRVPAEVRAALELAFARIVDYHAHEGTPPGPFESGGVTVQHLARPVRRVGLYAPGGRARYPSTVLMTAAPARVAGVAEIMLCVPPAADGHVDDATLAAAAIAGIT
jgi:histidinol dehydrogenase